MNSISILGCGWFGEPLAEALLEKEYNVKGSTTSGEKLKSLSNKGIEAYLIDLNPNFQGDSKFLESEILLINIPPKVKVFGEAYHINQIQSLLSVCQNQVKLKKIVLVSSTSVYPNEDKTMTEKDTDPDHFLKKVEDLVIDFAQKNSKKYLIVRFGGLMGYDRNPCKYFSKDTAHDHSRVNYLHRDDAIGSILCLIEENIWNETLNVLSPEHPSRSQIWLNCVSKSNLSIGKTKKSTNKVVSSEKFISRSKYQFKYPDPLAFKYL